MADSGEVKEVSAAPKSAATSRASDHASRETTYGSGASDKGWSEENTGATYKPRYFSREPDIMPVDVMDLQDFRSSGRTEFWQFLIGEFCVAGSFWVGLQRLFAAPYVLSDTLFWICLVAFVLGAVILFFGYLLHRQRKTRIDQIIEDALSQRAQSSKTP